MVNFAEPPGAGFISTAMMPVPVPVIKPEVLLISLSQRPLPEKADNLLVERLLEVANVKRAKTAAGAIHAIDNSAFNAIIATDEVIALPLPESQIVLAKIKTYLQNGGLVFLTLQFSDYLTRDHFDSFFIGLNLSWRRGDYHRTIFYFTPAGVLPKNIKWTLMPGPYSMKALHLVNATVNEKLFVPIPGALTESLVLPPQNVDEKQASIAMGKVGNGRIVFCGDVVGEEQTIAVIMALIGL